MPDGPRRAMVPDADSADMSDVRDENGHKVTTKCDSCGYLLPFGAWPFCKNGDFRTHWRDFSDAKLAEWDEASKATAKRPNIV